MGRKIHFENLRDFFAFTVSAKGQSINDVTLIFQFFNGNILMGIFDSKKSFQAFENFSWFKIRTTEIC